MYPPCCPLIWQGFAHGANTFINAFASPVRFAQDVAKALAWFAGGLFCDNCYPSPYPWPGPTWVGLSFPGWLWRRIAFGPGAQSLGFHPAPNAVESPPIKTITRGSVTCGNRPLSSWRFVRPPFQPVLTTIFSVAALAHLAGLSWPMRLAATSSPGRLLAQVQAWFVTIWASASKPNLAGQHCPPKPVISQTTRANGPGGFFLPAWRMAAPEGP